MFLLQLLGVLPAIINGVELLFKGFPGQGAVKKEVVMAGVRQVISAATSAGVNTAGWGETAGGIIDAYVATKNALGEFEHEPKDRP